MAVDDVDLSPRVTYRLQGGAAEESEARAVVGVVPRRVAVEAGAPMSWYRWVGERGVIVGIERFGASAPYQRIYQELGLTVERVVAEAKRLLTG